MPELSDGIMMTLRTLNYGNYGIFLIVVIRTIGPVCIYLCVFDRFYIYTTGHNFSNTYTHQDTNAYTFSLYTLELVGSGASR